MARSIQHILVMVYQAGGRNVPYNRLGWNEQDFPVVNQAIKAAYITRLCTRKGSTFSLTREGYYQIGQNVPPITLREIIVLVYSFLVFGRPYQ